MVTYSLEGHYEHRGTIGKLEGSIMLENGFFQGHIFDHGSRAPEQKLEGALRTLDGRTEMLFLKFPPHADLANLLYKLERKGKGKDFAGEYEGRWYAVARQLKVAVTDGESLLVALFDQMPEYLGNEKVFLKLKKQ